MNIANFQDRLLNQRYLQLRKQLDAAYTAAIWDSQSIDRIAAQMLSVERALSSMPREPSSFYGDGVPHVAPENFVRLSSF
jgi:hypothetical protein